MPSPRRDFTFLFTDIERSSHLWEQHPQTMGRALAQHDDLMRAALREHRGTIFKTVGDAFCTVFHSALDAMRAAVLAQQQLAAAAWGETGPLKVRMALHSGEAEERDGDYFGQTLNRVARVLAAGHGGQTLLSRVTTERVREDLPPDVKLRDLGERRLKDLSRPEGIFQLVIRDLPTEFPPLRSLEVLPNNLPAQVTSFVGRAREMAEVRRLVGVTRLLTLTGPGGTGKTRLSVQVAADLLEEFPHGVWLVELATLAEPELLPQSVAAVLEVREEADRPLRATLLDALRHRKLLLLLDNCEHLINACAELAETLLRHCPEIRILATSREALNIAGELTWAVPSLKTGHFWRSEERPDSAALAALDSVQLFKERAMAVLPSFDLTPEVTPIVSEICWRLDGIPLAIELAAARVRVLSPAQILERLDYRFRLLSGGRRTALPRQQTLGALIDWSYDLLSENERRLLRRLSIFTGGRTLEMAEKVCSGNGLEAWEILDLLGSLVDKSLLAVEPDTDGEPRYVLLESVWEYAMEKLGESGERDTLCERHLDYFVEFAEATEPLLEGPEQARWLERREVERFNLRRAIEWATDSPRGLERGLRLASALARFFEVHSYLKEGRESLEKVLEAATGITIIPLVLARALTAAGRIAWCQDRNQEAIRHFRAALSLFKKAGDDLEAGNLLCYIGFSERNEENLTIAEESFEQAHQIGLEKKSERLLAMAASGLGSIAADRNDLATARRQKEEAMRIFRKLGDQWVLSLVAWSTAKVVTRQRDFVAARQLLVEAVRLGRQLGNRWSVPYTTEGFGDIALAQNDAASAAQLYGAASVLRDLYGLSFSPSERTVYQGTLARMRAQLSPAIFEERWKEGNALRAQEALEFALTRTKAE